MKTSNKILLAIGLIMVAYLVGYDFALKTEYDKGEFRSRFYKMKALNFTNFKVIKNNGANLMGMRIEKGKKYGVWIHNELKKHVTVKQHGQTLELSYNEPENADDRYSYSDMVIITTPNIDSVITSPYVRPKSELSRVNYSAYTNTVVYGFNQPQLMVKANRYTQIQLDNDRIDKLDAQVGDAKTSYAELTVTDNNHIKFANWQVLGKSNLTLYGSTFDKCQYTIADSARVLVYGSSLKVLKQQQ